MPPSRTYLDPNEHRYTTSAVAHFFSPFTVRYLARVTLCRFRRLAGLHEAVALPVNGRTERSREAAGSLLSVYLIPCSRSIVVDAVVVAVAVAVAVAVVVAVVVVVVVIVVVVVVVVAVVIFTTYGNV